MNFPEILDKEDLDLLCTEATVSGLVVHSGSLPSHEDQKVLVEAVIIGQPRIACVEKNWTFVSYWKWYQAYFLEEGRWLRGYKMGET